MKSEESWVARNTCRFVLGEEPMWVTGATYSTPGDPRFKEVDENVVFQLGFPSGALGSFSCSFGTHLARRYRCLADRGGWIGMDPAFDYEGLQLEQSQVRGRDEFREKPRFPPSSSSRWSSITSQAASAMTSSRIRRAKKARRICRSWRRSFGLRAKASGSSFRG
jgi:GFO/IDH/MocA C-terminal domain